jgi:hypothetical protein
MKPQLHTSCHEPSWSRNVRKTTLYYSVHSASILVNNCCILIQIYEGLRSQTRLLEVPFETMILKATLLNYQDSHGENKPMLASFGI